MFRVGFAELCWPDAPIEADSTVGVLARVLGGWSLNAARIVYTIEEHEPADRFGFGYGTLPGHAALGEERFLVEWRRSDPAGDGVFYDLLSFSRPGQFLSRLGTPYTRRLQRRFAAGSLGAMKRAANPQGESR